MASDRFEKIQNLYNEARRLPKSQRDAFLLEACAVEPELRAEIDSLLSYESKAEEFFEEAPADISRDSLIGTSISHYRILEFLGAGGMGHVFRAEDTKLSRHVAVKILPKQFATDPTRLER